MSTSWLDSLNGSRFGNAPRVPLMQGRVMDDDRECQNREIILLQDITI